MVEQLKKEVCYANLQLPKLGLVLFTWGNVSGVDRESGVFVIKPSGVPYEELTPEMMVVMNLDGTKAEGKLNPSSDTPTHTALYNAFPAIGGITHTHSTFATSFAQAGLPLRALGTTHADSFYGDVPITRDLKKEEIEGDYERETGNVIIKTFIKQKLSPMEMPAVLVKSHAPFTWGKTALKSVENAAVLEECAKMAYLSTTLKSAAAETFYLPAIDKKLLDKHFLRKHGDGAYYGQG